MSTHIDLPSILSHLPLKKNGKGYMHSEHHSLKFYRYANKWRYKWFSRDESGDLIDFLQKHENKSFQEAKAYLYGTQETTTYSNDTQELSNQTPETPEWLSKKWQKKANRLVYYANDRLIKIKSEPLQFLKDRGLKMSTIVKWKLGFSPDQTINGNQFPAKHIIPVIAQTES